MSFDPRQHLIKMGNRDYLETKWRLVWFREDHPRGSILTELVSFDPVVVKATVLDGDNHVLATGHAGALDNGKAVWSGRTVEKAETGAIGRALASAGFGTQFSNEHNDNADEPVDSPVRSNGNGRQEKRLPVGEDLTDKGNARKFIEHWRGQGMSDAETLAALDVTKLSQYTKGRTAADEAVAAWKSAKDEQDGDGDKRALDGLREAGEALGGVVRGGEAYNVDLDAAYEATKQHFKHRAHFDNLVNRMAESGEPIVTTVQLIDQIHANREAEGKANAGWWQDMGEIRSLATDLKARWKMDIEGAMSLLGRKLGDFPSRSAVVDAVRSAIEARDGAKLKAM